VQDRSIRRMAPGLLVALALVLSLAVATALAHGELESADPAPESVVTRSPERVTARFSEELDPEGSRMVVYDAENQYVDLGDGGPDLTDPDRTLMSVSLRPDLADGVYRVEWVTQSAEDGHREEGSFSFTVDSTATDVATPQVVAPAATQEPLPVTDVDDDGFLDRATVIIGLVVVAIAVAVVATLGRRRWWR
jgi:methionine-rich copper-binding protein CopC